MSWPTKRQRQWQRQRQIQQRHLLRIWDFENRQITARNHQITARNRGTFTFDIQWVTLETCHLWDIWSEWRGDMTCPKNSTYPPTYLSTYLRAHPQDAILETCDLYDICSEWWGDLTWPKKPLRCCDIWDTNYNTDNWEPEFMTIFVTWQLIVTLDSIRNSCDVFFMHTVLSIKTTNKMG